jgi:hypothetical protein
MAPSESGYVIATTSSGEIRGRVADGVNVFKGVPYLTLNELHSSAHRLQHDLVPAAVQTIGR